jgi:hypothetical protein
VFLFTPAALPTFVGGGIFYDILTGVRWNLSVILIFITFMARDSEHFFMGFFGHLDFFL